MDLSLIVIQSALFIFLVLFFCFDKLYENKEKHYMIIFLIFYPFIIIYYCLKLSELIDHKYILAGISLVLTETLSLMFNAFIIKKFQPLYFGLFSGIASLIGLILFSYLWIKELLPIVYISSFWFVSNGYYILWIFISTKLCKLEEYYYSVMIGDYSVFLGMAYYIAYSIKAFINYIINKIKNDDFRDTQMYEFLTFLGEYAAIIIVDWILFATEANESFKNQTIFNTFISISVIVNFILCLVFVINFDNKGRGKGWFVYTIFYVFIMIIYTNLISCATDSNNVLCVLFMIFFNFLSIVLCIFFFGKDSPMMKFVYCLIANILTAVPFYFLWLKNPSAILYICITIFVVDIYIIVFSYLTKEKLMYEYMFNVITYNFGLFIVVFFIAGCAAALAIYIAYYICICLCATLAAFCFK